MLGKLKMAKAIDLFRLNDRVALVTGGAGIIGRPIAQSVAEAGATVVIASREVARCEQFAQELQSAGLRAESQELDLTSEASIRKVRDAILARHGRLDILFNNAVARAGGNLDQTSLEDWETSMKVNSSGLFLACKIFSESMRQARSGSIVNVASIYGVVGPTFPVYEGTQWTNPINYAFSKGGMVNLTRYLASFLAPYGVRVNCISPGGVEDGDTPPKFKANYSRFTPLGRMATENDIKGPALFLASDASSYITGQNILVDGGWSAI